MKIGDTQELKLKVVRAKMMIQTFVITARRKSCLMSWQQHMSRQDTKGQEVKDTFLFLIRKNVLFISSFLNVCFFLPVMEAEPKKK